MCYKSNLIVKLKVIFKKLRIKEEFVLKIGLEVLIKVLSEFYVIFMCLSFFVLFLVFFL